MCCCGNERQPQDVSVVYSEGLSIGTCSSVRVHTYWNKEVTNHVRASNGVSVTLSDSAVAKIKERYDGRALVVEFKYPDPPCCGLCGLICLLDTCCCGCGCLRNLKCRCATLAECKGTLASICSGCLCCPHIKCPSTLPCCDPSNIPVSHYYKSFSEIYFGDRNAEACLPGWTSCCVGVFCVDFCGYYDKVYILPDEVDTHGAPFVLEFPRMHILPML